MTLKDDLKKASFEMDDYSNPDNAKQIKVIPLPALKKICETRQGITHPVIDKELDYWITAISEIEKEERG